MVERVSIKILGICHRRSSGGFSLLELLVVVLLIGLLAGLVFPRFIRIYANFTISSQTNEIISTVHSASAYAFLSGEEITMQAFLSRQAVIPDGWSVSFSAPIFVRQNGFCTGGYMRLTRDDDHIEYYLLPPFCEVQRG